MKTAFNSVIPSEARNPIGDLVSRARFLAALGMTELGFHGHRLGNMTSLFAVVASVATMSFPRRRESPCRAY